MRIMGLDFGSKTVGVAISDSLLITAQGIEIIRRKEENKLRKTCARIEELIEEYEVDEIVFLLMLSFSFLLRVSKKSKCLPAASARPTGTALPICL